MARRGSSIDTGRNGSGGGGGCGTPSQCRSMYGRVPWGPGEHGTELGLRRGWRETEYNTSRTIAPHGRRSGAFTAARCSRGGRESRSCADEVAAVQGTPGTRSRIRLGRWGAGRVSTTGLCLQGVQFGICGGRELSTLRPARGAGWLAPDPATYPEATNILRSNRDVVRSLRRGPGGQMLLFDGLDRFTLYPDVDRVARVVLKNARGHAYHKCGEPLMEAPA